jgi:hypothetical protein
VSTPSTLPSGGIRMLRALPWLLALLVIAVVAGSLWLGHNPARSSALFGCLFLVEAARLLSLCVGATGMRREALLGACLALSAVWQ